MIQAKFEPGQFYHVINHAVGNENLFRKADNYRYFLEKYQLHTAKVWDTYAYCLMPNHFHLLIKVHDWEVISQLPGFESEGHKVVMQALSNWLNSYAKSYNKLFKRKGALFLDFTKRYLIDSETYYTAVTQYIHQNPVRHGFCKESSEWTYSSFRALLSDKVTRLKREELLEWFKGREGFLAFHRNNTSTMDPGWE